MIKLNDSGKSSLLSTDDLCIVSLSNSPWEHPYWTSRQFLMHELAKFCPVIYATGRKNLRDALTVAYLKSRLTPELPPFIPPNNLMIQRPPLLTPRTFRYRNTDNLLAYYYGELLRKKCKKCGKRKVVAYVWEPEHVELLEGLAPDLIAYHPYDKFEAMAKNEESKLWIRLQEEAIVKKADIIITPHRRIAKLFNRKNTHVVHNAVFTPALKNTETNATNEVFEGIPRPRLGYIGMISSKVDFALILEIARRKPNFSIILMGPKSPGPWEKSKELKKLMELSNIYFFPPINFNEVFEHMLQLDVGIMPYNLSGHAGYCESPLKMYQYWLCGLPVVTTMLPNIDEQPGIIYCGDSALEWIDHIEDALECSSDSSKKERRALAIKNSWQTRAETILSLLLQQMNGHDSFDDSPEMVKEVRAK